ncbi:MAG: Cna B-type domain-containing protein [Oscillospiraceae bacterium]|nr:Cna B-type domain-containing protein [Oscillospiraceae bacterium]
MRKRILPLLCLIVCLVLFLSCVAFAAPLDTEAEASLTLRYQKEGKAFPGLQIGIYRVAEASRDGSYTLIAPFSSYPVNIHGITTQKQWQNVAATLNAYIVADRVTPHREEKTDAEGTARFEKLETGLYLVREAVAESADGTYIFNQFMVYLPTPQSDGSYNYAVEAKPKCTEFIPKIQYTVTKLWQDAGNQSIRPQAVTVDIYKDGVLQETQILSADSNWTYIWSVSGEDKGIWTVTERDVPQRYKVTIQQNGSVFSLINTCQTEPDLPPLTGDSFAPLPWVLAMCISGSMLLILGAYSRRRQ